MYFGKVEDIMGCMWTRMLLDVKWKQNEPKVGLETLMRIVRNFAISRGTPMMSLTSPEVVYMSLSQMNPMKILGPLHFDVGDPIFVCMSF